MNLWDDNDRILAAFEEAFEGITETIPYKEEWAVCPKPENAIVNDADLSTNGKGKCKTVSPCGLKVIIIPTGCGNVVLHEKRRGTARRIVFVAAPYILSAIGLVPPTIIPYAGDIKRICGEASRPDIGEVYRRFEAYVLEINQDARQSNDSVTYLRSVT